MATGKNESLATDAAAFLRRSGHTIRGVGGNSEEIDQQAVRLAEWARIRGVILTDDFWGTLKKHPGTTAEHEVYYRAEDNRVIKVTYPGTFGCTPDTKGQQQAATPLFYLTRLELMNRVFDSELKLEGIAFGKSLLIGVQGEQPRMVVSQSWIRAANPRFPHPSLTELSTFMESLDFIPLSGAYFGWGRKSDRIKILDARPDNFINSTEGVIPIDLIICQD